MASLWPASVVGHGFGFVDGCVVVPAAAARGVAGLCRSNIRGLAVATSPESRAAPGGELVDLGSSLIQTRIHPPISPSDGTRTLMVRPTRSLVVTKRDIVRALRGC